MKISPTIKSAGKDNDASKEEERAFGNVGAAASPQAFPSYGHAVELFVCHLLLRVRVGTKAFLDYWLTWWATNKFGWTSNEYLLMYFGIFVVNGVFIFVRSPRFTFSLPRLQVDA